MTQTAASPQVSEPTVLRRSTGQSITLFVGKYGALIVLALLIIVFTVLSPRYFLTVGNIVQIFNQSALSAIVACGLTLVLASNQFDLSVGNTASLAGVTVAFLMIKGVPIPIAILVALLIGVAVGLVNALLVTRLNVNALVATLGVGSVAVGVNYFITTGSAQPFGSVVPEFSLISVGQWLGVPRNVYYMVVIVAILWVILNRTDLGRNIQAVGGNAEASRLAGVGVKGATTIAFVICSVCAAITGILLASVIGSGQPTGGDGYTLSAFAAAFLGTAVLREGQFHIVGTLVGVLTVTVGFNGLALAGVPSYVQFLFQGILLIAAVSFSTVARKMIKAGA
ncbi:MAG: Monosaccharide transporter rane protein family [Naasia sp.]|jgi:ribose transport system permease protein|uniref:ABC transporter permease n=1 Tax=Naasia sp. TaxID=2546198 RepID=UPI0026272242|nr:ABC transporter permease [Naasia sp.]MCU1569951.1 Monosaccharide transporter rane protein family [Naasia sp.]